MKNKYIIIYDGVCNLCAGTVTFIRRRDRYAVFEFIPAQNTAIIKKIYPDINSLAAELQTIVLLKNGKVFTNSDAVLEISKHLVGLWPLVSGFKILPKIMRDWCYKYIALNRYKIFGRRDRCGLN